jgi:hypothetical protein
MTYMTDFAGVQGKARGKTGVANRQLEASFCPENTWPQRE